MKRAPVLALAFLSLGASQCASPPYESDHTFKNSFQANHKEFPALVGGTLCKDADGVAGACAKRIPSGTDLAIEIPERPYSFLLKLDCSRSLGGGWHSKRWNVPKNQSFRFAIPESAFIHLRSFTCQGEVVPEDRGAVVSGGFAVAVHVFDTQYVAREEPLWIEDDLVMGKYSLYTTECRTKKKKTVWRNADPSALYFSESLMMRMNYAGPSD